MQRTARWTSRCSPRRCRSTTSLLAPACAACQALPFVRGPLSQRDCGQLGQQPPRCQVDGARPGVAPLRHVPWPLTCRGPGPRLAKGFHVLPLGVFRVLPPSYMDSFAPFNLLPLAATPHVRQGWSPGDGARRSRGLRGRGELPLRLLPPRARSRATRTPSHLASSPPHCSSTRLRPRLWRELHPFLPAAP